MQEANIQTTRALSAAFGAGDIPAVMEFLHEDVVLEFYGPEIIPYAGIYRGKTQARRFFETVLSSVTINRFDMEDVFAADDKVVVTGHLNLTARCSGRVIDSDFVHVITFADGRWLRFRDFMNTAVAVQAFRE